MKHWFDNEEEALYWARGGGWYCWKIQQRTRDRYGIHWSHTFSPTGKPRWYVGLDLPKYVVRRHWRSEEVNKGW